MEEYAQFFIMAHEEKEWHGNKRKVSEEKKLELRLGPPGEFLRNEGKRVVDDQGRYEGKPEEGNCWLSNTTQDRQCKKISSVPWSVLFNSNSSLYSSSTFQVEKKNKEMQLPNQKSSCPSSPCIEGFGSVVELQCVDNKTCPFPAATRDGTDAPLKRVAPAAVVGWPPIRSSRKNLANSCSSKQASELPSKTPAQGCAIKPESSRNDLFVKINMEGIPIGRKINLNAYDSYEKLSIAIDELFRGLLAAQREISAASNASRIEEAKATASGVGIGEYTLVYEDSEGDRILVGDVPWQQIILQHVRVNSEEAARAKELRTDHFKTFSWQQRARQAKTRHHLAALSSGRLEKDMVHEEEAPKWRIKSLNEWIIGGDSYPSLH